MAWIAAVLGCYRFAGANFLLSMLNLLPVRPLDGGQMAYALAARQPRPAGFGDYLLPLAWTMRRSSAAVQRGMQYVAVFGGVGRKSAKNLQNACRYKI